MRVTFLLSIILLISCNEDQPGIIKQCRLERIVANVGQVVETRYTYNEMNQNTGQTRTRDGVVDFSYVISYRSDGFVDKVDVGPATAEYTYNSDGTMKKQTVVDDATHEVTETRDFVWNGGKVEITFQRTSKTHPSQKTIYEFSGENIVRTLIESYNEIADNGELLAVSERVYSGFDTGISQFYLALQNRPGYAITSKNNHTMEVYTYTPYINGVAQSSTTTTTTYTYEYNKSNVPVSIVTTDKGTGVSYPTEITYENCPE